MLVQSMFMLLAPLSSDYVTLTFNSVCVLLIFLIGRHYSAGAGILVFMFTCLPVDPLRIRSLISTWCLGGKGSVSRGISWL